MQFVFGTFADAAYQGKTITEAGYFRQLLSYYDLELKGMLGDVAEIVRVGWLRSYEVRR